MNVGKDFLASEDTRKTNWPYTAGVFPWYPTNNIRIAEMRDIPRVAEILVFSKRTNYRHIFNDDVGSFVDLQVCSLAEEYAKHPEPFISVHNRNMYVYDDGFVKGLIQLTYSWDDGNHLVKQLYVDPFFEGQGIGGKLIETAIAELRVDRADHLGLWVLDENERAKKFYRKHGFYETGETQCVPEVPNSNVIEVKMIKYL